MWRADQKNGPVPLSDSTTEENRWDRMAPMFRQWMEIDDYPSKLLSLTQLRPEWSVLDVGCGSGAIAIEAAKRSRTVTALDISAKMLEILKSDAAMSNLGNITCLHRSWESIRIGDDIFPHDVVIASRSIARTDDLQKSLMKIDQASIRYAYVTAWGGGERGLNKGIRDALGQEYQDTPDFIYVFNLLCQMGIHPNIEHIECQSRIIYPTLADVMHNYKALFHLSPEEVHVVEAFLKGYLIQRDDGQLEVPDNRPVWSLIWWKK
ncbi:MAG TPA: methyltransferase domain-containing protein [Methanospirillum sp.]|nr:methyltransferase domain-containing protein [Methanospirillum sp.]